MVLIETNYKNFKEYISSLSGTARTNYKYAIKQNKDLEYKRVEFNKQDVKMFMELWGRQLVRGFHPHWAFPIEHIERLNEQGKLMVFKAGDIAMHFVQIHNGFIECHPPMYDKKHNHRYLAKFMWFNLIKYAIENKLNPLDLGGGASHWVEHIKTRQDYPNPKYKWVYVPKKVKENPDKQINYFIQEKHGEKTLSF